MDWLEVSLIVNGELAEAVAEVFSRYSGNGVTLEQGISHLDDNDAGRPNGPITVRAYLPADAQVQEKRRQIEEALHYLGMIQAVPAPTFRSVAEQNWMEAWRRHYRPIPIGRRLMVLPAWMESEDANRIAIKIDPGMAFGTGTHPSTQLSLELIEQFLDSARPHVVRPQSLSASALIDVGCGSGILSIAALKLGVRSALGVDIDPDAIRNARENASINGVGEALELAVGSVGEVLDGAFGLKSAPLVVANILAPVIVHLLGQGLTRLLEPGGCIILSGILKSQTEDVEEAARSAGLSIGERLHSGDWVALSASL